MDMRHCFSFHLPKKSKKTTLYIAWRQERMKYCNITASSLNLFPNSNDTTIESLNENSTSDAQLNKFETVFDIICKTRTKIGTALLKTWLKHPLSDEHEIARRHFYISLFFTTTTLLCSLRDSAEQLLRYPEWGFALKKLESHESKTVSLNDLIILYRSIIRFQAIGATLHEYLSDESSYFSTINENNKDCKSQLFHDIYSFTHKFDKFLHLVEDLLDIESIKSRVGRKAASNPYSDFQYDANCIWKDNWIRVKPKFSPELSRLHDSIVEIQQLMQSELNQLNQSVSNSGSKSKGNKPLIVLENSDVHGPHFRATKKEAPSLLKKLTQIQKPEVLSNQKSGCLFVTPRLKSLCVRFKKAKAEYEDLQRDIIQQAVKVASTYVPAMKTASGLLAELDCLSTLAYVAMMSDWVAPKIMGKGSKELLIEELRHPCLEAKLGHGRYIASNVNITSSSHGCILTGPNMGGKSTFMRALGVCVVLAHMGSFVPAKRAQIPLYDQLLMRIGATDCAEKGQSTFMAEMDSVAGILRAASADSLVMVDELGRGTSTQDGFGLAWAVIHNLVYSIRCSLLFATHFHELTAMATEDCSSSSSSSSSQNLHVGALVKEDPCSVSMLYEVQPGACERSYGIHVARAAGFPATIIEGAETLERQMVRTLEGDRRSKKRKKDDGYCELKEFLDLIAGADHSDISFQMQLARDFCKRT